jgi:hypothetical protein
MNESTVKEIANEQMPIYTAISGFVNKTNYINIGVITKVHSENYVDVSFYYTDSTGTRIVIQAVRLLHIGTTKCKLLITPAVGDNVLLLCPKDFIEKLEYNHIPKKSKSSYLPYGNINMCGILIKDESNTNVKTTITVNENGEVLVKTSGAIAVNSDETISFDGDGFGGLCKTQELKSQLDILSGRLDSVVNGLKNSATAAEDGGATYKAGIVATINAYTQKEDFSEIESDKVKHGDGSSS